jgi:formylmethanofuran dehydrogenase subunit A
MDRAYRAEMVSKIHPGARKGTLLADLDREYSLSEIAVITRAGTARALGLKNKGHLGVGADADVTVYEPQDDVEAMFSRPRYVIKAGEVIVEDGRLLQDRPGRTLYVRPDYDPGIRPAVRKHFEETYTISFDNYAVQEEYLLHGEVVPCT